MKICENGVVRDMAQEEEKAFAEQMAETPEEEIARLKQELSETDYKAIKYAEGWISEEEYAPVRAERQKLRDRINALEAEWYPEEVANGND